MGSFVRLIAELLKKGEVVARHGSTPLLKVVPPPLQRYLPHAGAGCRCYGLSVSGRRTSIRALAEVTQGKASMPLLERDGPDLVVFAVGVAEGDVVREARFGGTYASNLVCICPWDIRSQVVCQMICHEYMTQWNICEG